MTKEITCPKCGGKYKKSHKEIGACNDYAVRELTRLFNLPFNEQKVTLSSIPIKNVQSFYTKYGDWFAVICTLISLITLFFGWLQKRS